MRNRVLGTAPWCFFKNDDVAASCSQWMIVEHHKKEEKEH